MILDFLIEKVEAGLPLHQAMHDYGAPFDDMVVGMVRAADASGRMAEVLHQLADLLERSVELRRELVGATIYPMIVAGLILASVVVLVTFILPRLLEPLKNQPKMVMPWPTQVLLAFAGFMQSWWWAVLLAIVVGWVTWRYWVAKPGNRYLVDRLILRTPWWARSSGTWPWPASPGPWAPSHPRVCPSSRRSRSCVTRWETPS